MSKHCLIDWRNIVDIDITEFYGNASMIDYSASVAEIGDNAGADTWRAACEDSSDYMMLDTEDKQEAFKAYIKDFGAWDDAEVAAWSNIELNALFMQFIAGDIRQGNVDRIFVDGFKDGRKVYYSLD